MPGWQRGSRRITVGGAILLLHAGAGWVLIHATLPYLASDPAAVIDVLEVRPITLPRMPATAPRRSPRSPTPTRRETVPPLTPAAPAVAPTRVGAAGLVAAEGYGPTVAASQTRRGFGFPKRAGTPRVPRSIFEPPPARVGRADRLPDGERIFWLTEDCYVSLGSDSLILKDVQALHRVLAPTCKLSGSAPRTDLFAPLGRRLPGVAADDAAAALAAPNDADAAGTSPR